MLILQSYSFCHLLHYNLDISNFWHKKFFIIQNYILSDSCNDFCCSLAKNLLRIIWIDWIILRTFAMSKSITNQTKWKSISKLEERLSKPWKKETHLDIWCSKYSRCQKALAKQDGIKYVTTQIISTLIDNINKRMGRNPHAQQNQTLTNKNQTQWLQLTQLRLSRTIFQKSVPSIS